jgi:hypothetical protein
MNDSSVQFDGVSKRYTHFSLENIHLDLPTGSIMGFIGANGAGKSTTMRILMGLVHQDEGSVRVLGHPMPADQAAAKLDIGFVSEDMRLYGAATLAWHMNFMRPIYPRWDQPYADKLAQRFDLKPQQKIKGLSHGQRVKAAHGMNYSMVKSLILKDWYFQRTAILLSLAGGVLSLGIVAFGGQPGFTLGLILLVTIMVMLSAMSVMGNTIGERENQTLAFSMSLPISYLEFTTSKILGNLRGIPYSEVIALVGYLNGHTPFTTKHNTKGDEFENVLVVLGRGWNRYDFDQLLQWMAKPGSVASDRLSAFERNRNLFYVCCSRSITNLALLFTQQLSSASLSLLISWFGQRQVIDVGAGGFAALSAK